MTEICDASNAKDLRSAIIAACAMLLTFAAVAVPVPLYAEYKIALGLTDADISLTMVSYLTGVLTTLFVGGSLSDALGRRPLVAAALLFGSLACALYIWLPNGAALQIARMVQGVSCGLTMSATSAFMLDCTSQRYRTFGKILNGNAEGQRQCACRSNLRIARKKACIHHADCHSLRDIM